MRLQPPPTHLVEGGRIHRFGMFSGAIRDSDLRSFRLYGPLGRLRLKQWHHYAVVHPDLALSFATVDAGFQRVGWVQIVDRRSGERVAFEFQAPWLDVAIAPTLFGGRSHLRAGEVRVEIDSELHQDRHIIRIEAPDLQAELLCHASATPLEVVLPVGRGRAMWSHKVPLPVEGQIHWRGRPTSLDPAQSTIILDLHKAHYPHHTWWRWGTGVGYDADGRRVAFNLTRNLVEDPALHECALWIDGELSLLSPPHFQVEADPWTATGEGLDLQFTGHGERTEDLSVGPLVSRFRQRYGLWSGQIREIELTDAWGLAEDHVSRW